MSGKSKDQKLKARLPRGFADRLPTDIRAVGNMTATIAGVFERYGFEPVETPFIEYTDALGKFLPDQDQPNEGVFSFQDDDEQWLSLRYDLTAPLARYFAENAQNLPRPYRSYRSGWVFRNEKPGPGRFRQFMQFDADSVGSASTVADAEICMMTADTMEELGIPRSDYVVRVNNRKVLDGVMETIGLAGEDKGLIRLSVLRAIDKLDRLGEGGVRDLLGEGREDESGAFTKGSGLASEQIQTVLAYVASRKETDDATIAGINDVVSGSEIGFEGCRELAEIAELTGAAGYGDGRIIIDPSVVRGLEYYTGPVFEAELTFEVPNEKGQPVVFGSVGGGGRYDGLVGRFRGEDVPATGFSIGVSRLASALNLTGRLGGSQEQGPVVVAIMDRERTADFMAIAQSLRSAGIRAEAYVGSGGMKAQFKYADRRNAPCVVIQGESERAAGKLQIKDLAEGRRQAAAIAEHSEWQEQRPGQFEIDEGDLLSAVTELLRRQSDDGS